MISYEYFTVFHATSLRLSTIFSFVQNTAEQTCGNIPWLSIRFASIYILDFTLMAELLQLPLVMTVGFLAGWRIQWWPTLASKCSLTPKKVPGFIGMGQVTYWSCVACWNNMKQLTHEAAQPFLADVAVQKHDYLGALKTSQGQRTRDGRTAVQGVTHGQKTKQIINMI